MKRQKWLSLGTLLVFFAIFTGCEVADIQDSLTITGIPKVGETLIVSSQVPDIYKPNRPLWWVNDTEGYGGRNITAGFSFTIPWSEYYPEWNGSVNFIGKYIYTTQEFYDGENRFNVVRSNIIGPIQAKE